MSTTRARTVVAMLVTALAVTACAGGPSEPGTAPPSPVAEVVAERDCFAAGLPDPFGAPHKDPDAVQAPRAGSVPEDFVVDAVYRCDPGGYLAGPDGRWMSGVEERLDVDVRVLLEVLSIPSDARSTGPCTADLEIVPTVWLVDPDGRAMLPVWPRNGCGKLKEEVNDFFSGLRVLEAVEVRRGGG